MNKSHPPFLSMIPAPASCLLVHECFWSFRAGCTHLQGRSGTDCMSSMQYGRTELHDQASARAVYTNARQCIARAKHSTGTQLKVLQATHMCRSNRWNNCHSQPIHAWKVIIEDTNNKTLFHEKVPAKKQYSSDDDQLHSSKASPAQARISQHNSDYLRFGVSSMNLLRAAPRCQIPPRNVATYSRRCHRANEL